MIEITRILRQRLKKCASADRNHTGAEAHFFIHLISVSEGGIFRRNTRIPAELHRAQSTLSGGCGPPQAFITRVLSASADCCRPGSRPQSLRPAARRHRFCGRVQKDPTARVRSPPRHQDPDHLPGRDPPPDRYP